MSVDIRQGDARAVLAGLPAGSVHTCITSPPYYNLRDYGTATWEGGDGACDHMRPLEAPRSGRAHHLAEGNRRNEFGGPTDLAQTDGRRSYRGACGRCGARRVDAQIGAEETPQDYVAHLVEVFRAVHRVLRDDGTCWIVIGDSYASARPCSRRSVVGQGSMPDGKRAARPPRMGDGLKDKDLMMIPHRVALALQEDGWYVRNDCVWAKGSAMPESVQDRFSRAHEYVFHLAKSERYYFDPIAVAEPAAEPERQRHERIGGATGHLVRHGKGGMMGASATRNRRSVLHINPQPFSAADFGVKDIDHYAVFPEKLVEILTLCSTSEAGCCPRCSAPYRRVVERETVRAHGGTRVMKKTPLPVVRAGWREGGPVSVTTGWQAGCSCEAGPLLPCTTLDPFAGSGTTLLVARRFGRSAIGVELNAAYCALARKRVDSSPEALFSAAAYQSSTEGAAR